MGHQIKERIAPDDLCYPVLLIGARFIEVVYSSSSLCSATKMALKKRVYETSTCIDSEGRLFKFDSVKFVSYKPPFFGFRIFTGRAVIVDLLLKLVRRVDLSDVVTMVRAKLPYANWGASEEFMDDVVSRSKTVREFIEGLDGSGPKN